VSFGAAPAFLALQVIKVDAPEAMPAAITRLIWAFGALYVACAAIRLARFNVSNEHGEQHHFSFLGLPSPGAAGAITALVLMQQDLQLESAERGGNVILQALGYVCVWLLPPMLLICGLLMVSTVRYPHIVNRYLRGRRPIARLIGGVALLLAIVVAHRYVLGIGTLAYVLFGIVQVISARFRSRAAPAG
jgi:CDP-diacylglycerol--serine O-phosphatidyltransferase